jgi:photosystem II stability/assembly factor-like uncharacterized protein
MLKQIGTGKKQILGSVCIALLGLILAGRASAGWTVVAGPLPGGVWSMSFCTPETGFVATSHAVLRTTDGGLSFQDVTPQRLVGPACLASVSPDTCLLWCTSGLNQRFAEVWRTTDAGVSWQDVLSISYPGSGVMLIGLDHLLSFSSTLSGVVPLASGDSSLACTTDGGTTWRALPLTNCNAYYTKTSFPDTLTGYALTDNSALWRTSDAGSTWTRVLCCADCNLIDDLHFTGPATGYLVYDTAVQNGSRYEVRRTTDAGLSWQGIFHVNENPGRMVDIEHLLFWGADTGYVSVVVSPDNNDDFASLLKTTDGARFVRQHLPMKKVITISAMSFPKGPGVGYLAVQSLEPIYGGCWLLKTVDGGGDSMSFWEPKASLPEGNKKGCLLAYVPDSLSLYRLDLGSGKLWSCRTDSNLWTAHRTFPAKPKFSGMTFDGTGLVVTMANSNLVWSYDPESDSWYQLPVLPKDAKVKSGGGITSDAGDPLFVLPGGKKNQLWSYERGDTAWHRLRDVPGAAVTTGGCVACDNDYVYVLKGGKLKEFWAFDIENDSWLRLPDIPGIGIKSGSSLCADKQGGSNNLLALKGGGNECWSYELDGYWKLLPGIPGKGNQSKGSQLSVDDAGTWYAVKGKGKRFAEIWQTDQLCVDLERGNTPMPVQGGTQTSAAQSIPTPIEQVPTIINSSQLSLPEMDWQTVSVYDIAGRRIANLRNLRQGPTTIDLPAHLSQGVYLVTIRTPQTNTTQKLIVTH